jgi:hypothetical protein
MTGICVVTASVHAATLLATMVVARLSSVLEATQGRSGLKPATVNATGCLVTLSRAYRKHALYIRL